MKIKRLLAVVLSTALVFSMMPALVFADEAENETKETEVTEVAETTKGTKETEETKAKKEETSKPAETEATEKETEPSGSESEEETVPSETEPTEAQPSETKPSESEPAESSASEEEAAPTETDETEPSAVEGKENAEAETDSREAKDKIIATGQCGDNSIWTLDGNGKLSITGTGDVYSFMASTPWYDHRAKIKSIYIADGITGYAMDNFKGLTNVVSLSIAGSVKFLENQSFSDCKKLTTVTLGEGVVVVGTAFQACTSLKSISIPSTVRSISQNAFASCKSLTSITLPANATAVGTYAFSGCTSLKTVKLPDKLECIYDSTFSGCTALTSIRIPKGVTYIGKKAFCDCTSLISVTLPDTVTLIKSDAFMNCTSLTGINLPDSCINFGDNIFSGCTALTSIAIPSGSDRISISEFSKCTNLKMISIPKSVNYIFTNGLADCINLTDIYYMGTAADWAAAHIDASNKDVLKNVNVHYSGTFHSLTVKNIEGGGITLSKYSATAGETIKVKATAHSGYYTGGFAVNGIKYDGDSFPMPDEDVTVEPIFYPILRTTVGDSLLIAGSILFFEVTNNAIDGTGTVKCNGTEFADPYSVSDPDQYFGNLVIPSTVSFGGVTYKVTAIAPRAFMNLIYIKNLTIGSNVVVIGDNAFYGCTGLVKVSGGAGLKTIGNNAFARCTKLASFIVTSKVLSKIGTYAFNKDLRLKTIYIRNTVKLTKKGVKKALKGSKIKTVKVKKSKIKKYKKYFTKKNCGKKVKVKK